MKKPPMYYRPIQVDICLNSMLFWSFLDCSMPNCEHHMKHKIVLAHLPFAVNLFKKKDSSKYHIKQNLIAYIQVVEIGPVI